MVIKSTKSNRIFQEMIHQLHSHAQKGLRLSDNQLLPTAFSSLPQIFFKLSVHQLTYHFIFSLNITKNGLARQSEDTEGEESEEIMAGQHQGMDWSIIPSGNI